MQLLLFCAISCGALMLTESVEIEEASYEPQLKSCALFKNPPNGVRRCSFWFMHFFERVCEYSCDDCGCLNTKLCVKATPTDNVPDCDDLQCFVSENDGDNQPESSEQYLFEPQSLSCLALEKDTYGLRRCIDQKLFWFAFVCEYYCTAGGQLKKNICTRTTRYGDLVECADLMCSLKEKDKTEANTTVKPNPTEEKPKDSTDEKVKDSTDETPKEPADERQKVPTTEKTLESQNDENGVPSIY